MVFRNCPGIVTHCFHKTYNNFDHRVLYRNSAGQGCYRETIYSLLGTNMGFKLKTRRDIIITNIVCLGLTFIPIAIPIALGVVSSIVFGWSKLIPLIDPILIRAILFIITADIVDYTGTALEPVEMEVVTDTIKRSKRWGENISFGVSIGKTGLSWKFERKPHEEIKTSKRVVYRQLPKKK